VTKPAALLPASLLVPWKASFRPPRRTAAVDRGLEMQGLDELWIGPIDAHDPDRPFVMEPAFVR